MLKATKNNSLKKLLRTIRAYRLLLALSLVLALCSVTLSLYVPVLVGQGVDLIPGAGRVDFSGLLLILLKIGLAVACNALLQWLLAAVNNKLAFQVSRKLRNKVFRKLQVLPMSSLDARPHGEIISRMLTDVEQLADGLLLGFSQLFTGLATIAGTLGFMLLIHWRLALVVALLTPLSLFAAQYIAGKSYRLFQAQSEIRGEQTAFIDEMLEGQKLVRAFAREERVLDDFDRLNEELEAATRDASFFSSLTNPVTRFVNSLVYAGLALAGALVAISSGGLFTVGQLVVFLSYANQYTKPFNEISGVVTELQNALACADRIFDLIDAEPEPPEPVEAENLNRISGSLTLENVDFSYSPDKPLIRDFTLHVSPGQRIALVGATGSGKTTIINLLLRFYETNSGSIRVEGRDIRNLTRHSLRAGFGMVLQDSWLKSGTIRENICLGKTEATEEEILNAAKAAYAHSFIRRLPNGYDTVIGEDGGSLSQGQKQLLCIARVMLCRPPMLILDEATSSVDTRTEAKLQAAFARLMEGRTSIVVAHRLSTVREADLILVMQDGRIAEQGRHRELLQKGGIYAKLYYSQFVT